MQRQIHYLKNLTPFRGIAALLVVIYHLDLMLGIGGGGLVPVKDSIILSKMYLMVDFFFILSGFIMCYVYSKWFVEAVSFKEFKRFIIARFARIYPIHLLTLFYTITLFYISSRLKIPEVPVLQVADSTISIITNLLLIHSLNLHNWFTWNHASWSISAEWWAYMVFPLLVKPIMRLKTKGILLGIGLCFSGYILITYILVPLVTIPSEIPFVKLDPAKHVINVAYQFGYIRCLCGFILGMCIYQCYKAGWGSKLLDSGFILTLVTIGLFTCMHLDLPDFITVAFFPLILLCGTYGSSGINKLFSKKPLQLIGDWSFSIYMIHEPLLYTFGAITTYLQPIRKSLPSLPPPVPDRLTNWIISIPFIIITLFISFLTYRYIEMPARKLINGLSIPANSSISSTSIFLQPRK